MTGLVGVSTNTILGFDCGFNVERIGGVYKIKLDVVVGQNLGKETEGPAVGVIGNNDMVACFDQSQGGIDGGHSRSKGKTEFRAF
jgi:hypothetical protein